MKRLLTISLILTVALMSCYKDSVDVNSLVTNPYDPDYNGPDLLVIDQVVTIPSASRVLVVNFHVDTTLFNELVPYKIRIDDASSGVSIELVETPDHTYAYNKLGVAPGVDYCFDMYMVVNDALTKSHNRCFTAN